MPLPPPDYFTARTIGTGQSNPGDVRRLRSTLKRTGHGRFPGQGAPNVTPGLMEAVKRFQTDFGLEPDAVIRPGGPTERALSMALRARNRQGPAAMEALRDTFAQRSRAGLTFQPHPRDRNAGQWVDATGRTLTDAQADPAVAERMRSATVRPSLLSGGDGMPVLTGSEGQDDLSTAGPGTARKEAGHGNPVTPEILRRRARVKAIPRPTGVLKPDHAPEEFLDRVEGFKRRFYVEDWRKRGWKHAADNLERYLDGSGKRLDFSREHARNFTPIREAEARNRESFANKTFLARTGDDAFNERLKNLKEGDEPLHIEDNWDGAYKGVRAVLGAVGAIQGEQDFYRAFGRTNLKSESDVHATRKGDIIYLNGTVTHDWNDRYDFDVGQPGAGDAHALERDGRARPFAFGAKWKQRVRGTVRVRDGELTEPRVEWTDLDE